MSRRLPASAHTAQSWQIHALAPDFDLHDVWRVRTPGASADEFAFAVAAILGGGGRPTGEGHLSRSLFAVRWRIGALFGWDRPEHGLGTWTSAIAERVHDSVTMPALPAAAYPEPNTPSTSPSGSPFSLVYRLPQEEAREMANATVHGILHLGWVPGPEGDYELHVAVLTKPNGRRTRLYMRLIMPFRLLIVWPAMIGAWERRWLERDTVTGGRLDPSHTPIREPRSPTLDPRPHRTRDADTHGAPDYLDEFTITTDLTASAREWMTACFEKGIERSGRDFIFGRLLALRTERDGSPGSIAGWQVVDEDSGHLTVQANGPHVGGSLSMERVEGGMRFTTAMRYHTRSGRLRWEQLSRVHRRKAAGVLRTGAAILRRSRAGEPEQPSPRDSSRPPSSER